MSWPVAVRRGCGTRQAGGAYWETEHGPDGYPLEAFLLDPPVPVPDGLAVASQGVLPFEREGVTHVLDRVGLEYYPNVLDFLEEVRRFGLSRRIPKTFPFEKLSARSRILLVHDRAYVATWRAYETWTCPKQIGMHDPALLPQLVTPDDPQQPMCAGIWWEDVTGGLRLEDREVLRSMPSFEYSARCRPDGVQPEYHPAFFASFPCGRIAVVQGEDHLATMQLAAKSGLRVDEVDQ